MDASIVIPCYGGADLTAQCLDSLASQQGGHDLQVLLVDNKNDPDTIQLAQRFRWVEVLVQERNLGFAGGVNRGLRLADRDFVMVLNNDTRAAPNLLDRLHHALASDPRIGLCAPVSNRVKGAARIDCGDLGREADDRAELAEVLAQNADGIVQDVDFLSGLCLLAHRSTWQRLGGFDERFGVGMCEDDDLSLRAKRLGMRIVIARDAFLFHEGHQTFRAMQLDLVDELRKRTHILHAKWQHDDAAQAMFAGHAGDLHRAADYAARAMSTQPCWPDASLHLARHEAATARFDEAIGHLQTYLGDCPNDTDAVILLSQCLLHTGQPDLVSKVLSWASTHCWFDTRQTGRLLSQLGAAEMAAGRFDHALPHLDAACELRPEDTVLAGQLGTCLLQLGRHADALPRLSRAAADGDALATTNLGICHFHLGEHGAAVAAFSKAMRLAPDDPTVRANYEMMAQALCSTS